MNIQEFEGCPQCVYRNAIVKTMTKINLRQSLNRNPANKIYGRERHFTLLLLVFSKQIHFC